MSIAPGRCVPHQVYMDGSLLPVEGIEQKAAFLKMHKLIELVAPGDGVYAANMTYVQGLDMAAVRVLQLGGEFPVAM